jgi:hypothetical protein
VFINISLLKQIWQVQKLLIIYLLICLFCSGKDQTQDFTQAKVEALPPSYIPSIRTELLVIDNSATQKQKYCMFFSFVLHIAVKIGQICFINPIFYLDISTLMYVGHFTYYLKHGFSFSSHCLISLSLSLCNVFVIN